MPPPVQRPYFPVAEGILDHIRRGTLRGLRLELFLLILRHTNYAGEWSGWTIPDMARSLGADVEAVRRALHGLARPAGRRSPRTYIDLRLSQRGSRTKHWLRVRRWIRGCGEADGQVSTNQSDNEQPPRLDRGLDTSVDSEGGDRCREEGSQVSGNQSDNDQPPVQGRRSTTKVHTLYTSVEQTLVQTGGKPSFRQGVPPVFDRGSAKLLQRAQQLRALLDSEEIEEEREVSSTPPPNWPPARARQPRPDPDSPPLSSENLPEGDREAGVEALRRLRGFIGR